MTRPRCPPMSGDDAQDRTPPPEDDAQELRSSPKDWTHADLDAILGLDDNPDPAQLSAVPELHIATPCLGEDSPAPVTTVAGASPSATQPDPAGASTSGTGRPRATVNPTLRIEGDTIQPHQTASKRFRQVLQSMPLPSKLCWTKIPTTEKRRMYDNWKGKFPMIDPDVTDSRMFSLWDRHVNDRFKDLIYRARQKQAENRPVWMSEKEHAPLLASMQSPEGKKMSTKNKANRSKNPRKHTYGAKPHDEHHRLLEEKYGRSVPPDELHLVLYTKKDGTIVDQNAHQTQDRFKESLSQRLPTPDSQPTEEGCRQAFLEAAGGVRPDGSVPGLNSYGRRLYADVPHTQHSGASSSSGPSPIEQHLREEVQQIHSDMDAMCTDFVTRVTAIEAGMQAKVEAQVIAAMAVFFRS